MSGIGVGTLILQGAGTGIDIGTLLADTRVSVPSMMFSGQGQTGYYFTNPGTGHYVPDLRSAAAGRQEYMEELQALYAQKNADLSAEALRREGSGKVGEARVRVGRGNVVSSGSANDVQLSVAATSELAAIMAKHSGRIESDLRIARAQLAHYDKLLAEASYVAPYEQYSGGKWFGGYYSSGSFGGTAPNYAGAAGVAIEGVTGGMKTLAGPGFA